MSYTPSNRATITVDVDGADTSQRQIETVGDAMRRLNGSSLQGLGGQVDGIQSRLGGLKTALAGVAAFTATAFAVGAFTNMIRDAIDATDAASDLSQKTGIAVEDLAGLELAFQKGGMESSAMAGAMARLSKGIVDGNETFERLKLSSKNLDGSFKDNKKMLYELADSFAGMEDGAAKSALATQLFGKSGVDMIPMLNEGSAGLREMDEMAHKLGLSLSKTAVDEAGKFNDTMDLIKLSGQGMARGIAAELLPTLSNLAGQFFTTMMSGDKLKNTAAFLANGLKILYTVGVGIVGAFSVVGSTLGAAAAQAVAILQGNFRQASEIGRLWKEDVTKTWTTSADTIAAAWNNTGDASVEAMAALVAKNKAAGASAAETAAKVKAANKAHEEQAKILSELNGLTGTFSSEWDQLSKVYAKGLISTDQLTKAQADLLAKQPAIKAAADAEAKSMEKLDAFTKQYAASLTMLSDVMNESVSAAVKEAEEQETLASTYGLTASEVNALELARLEEQLAQRASSGLTLDEINGLEKLISAKKRTVAAMRTMEEVDAQKRVWESIETTAHDTFVSIFDGGKSTFDRLTDTLKNGLYDFLYQMTVKKWLINIGASVGLTGGASGVAQAGSAVGNLAGSGSTLSSISGLSGLANFGGTAIAGVGNFIGSSTLSAFGAGFAGETAGMAMSASEMFATMGMAAESTAAGIGALASAALPYVAAIGVAVALWKKFDTSGTYHTGGASSASAAGSQTIRAESIGFQNTKVSTEVNDMTAQLARGVVGILDSTALTFGKTAGYTAATAFADDTSKDGAWGSLVIKNLDGKVIDWNDTRQSKWAPREFADGEKGQEQYLGLLSRSVRTALDGIGLPSWAKTMLNSLGSDAGLDQLAQVVQEINKMQNALKGIGQQMSVFANLSDGVASKLITAAGGIDALANSAAAYYNAFYSESEKSAAGLAQVSGVLASVGLTMPATKAEFRALVEANMALGEAGAKTVTTLLSVSSMFAELKDTVGEATTDLTAYRSTLTEAYNAEAESLKSTISRLGSFSTSLRNLKDAALLGNLSPLTPSQKYAEAKSQYEAVLAAARAGDESAQGRYQDAYTAFLEASRVMYASSIGYRQDFDYAQAATAEAAKWVDTQIDVGQAQLTALNTSVSGIIEVNKSVLSVREALLQYQAAAAGKGQGPLVAYAPTAPGPISYSSFGVGAAPALASEVKRLQESNNALLAEVRGLRSDQSKQTGDQIMAMHQATGNSADKIANATTGAIRSNSRSEVRVMPE